MKRIIAVGLFAGVQLWSGLTWGGKELPELENDKRVEVLRVRSDGGLASNETVHFYVTVGKQGELTGLSEKSEYAEAGGGRWKLVREVTLADLYNEVTIIERSGRTIISLRADQNLDPLKGGILYLYYFHGIVGGYHYLTLKVTPTQDGGWTLKRYDLGREAFVPLQSIQFRVRGARRAPLGVADPTEFNTF